jgi:hypothetical protein
MLAALVLSALAQDGVAQGYRFPNLRSIEPAQPSGRPMLVHTSCASPEDPGYTDTEAWDTPISVYSDADIEIFVGQRCVAVYAQSFDSTGQYSVDLYTQYKGDAFCRMFASRYSPKDHPNQGFLQECHSIVYRSSQVSVDTRKKTMRWQNTRLEDSDGRDLGPIQGDAGWYPIESFDRPSFHAITLSVEKITQLVGAKTDSKPARAHTAKP